MFDRYYRGTNTNSAMEGSGLGMAASSRWAVELKSHPSLSMAP
ncbi:hypothetical protein MJA45_05700 [Paenibacillus aurantius]|uniref:Uncharacterized protein n=1 Tax=Paenibacillus aurantius TaxID=2918900 RepID=A0AA96RIT4_9BACL|nr:hypothetical protein [Paenibacillus aurantius]WNQ12524.1 hypothetical protein MJA45_05700 [Paenibacillus aurantius]